MTVDERRDRKPTLNAKEAGLVPRLSHSFLFSLITEAISLRASAESAGCHGGSNPLVGHIAVVRNPVGGDLLNGGL